MPRKVTRRSLALIASVPVLAEPARPQQPAADDDLEIQRQNLRRNREQMARVAVPIATEPAFTFKA